LVSQSGTILGTLLSRGAARGIGFSRMISVGNEADLGVGALVDLLTDDPETDAILLFLEALRDAPALAAAARRAFKAGKPVIAYKLGRSEVGRAVALSHSGALAGEDAAIDAFFRAHGIVRVGTLEGLFEAPPLLIGARPAKGRRVAVMTTTGGGAATVVDRLGAAGMTLVPAPERLHARLAEFNLKIGRGPIVDLTMAGTRDGIYGAALKELLDGDECDAVVCVVGSSAQFHPDLAVRPIVEAAADAAKPVAGFMVPEAGQSLRLLADAGIAAFRTPEACADAMRAYFDWRTPADQGGGRTDDLKAATVVLGKYAGRAFDEAMSLELFSALGIPAAPHAVIGAGGDTPGIVFPVAVKALSADLPHKTEAGAVQLGIADDAALRAAITRIAANVGRYLPKIRIDRYLVQSMATGVGEVLIGFRIDPQVGPVVVLAPGGVLAELYGDSAIRLAPVDAKESRRMIDQVTGLAPLRGYRNLPKGDLAALADVIVRLSRLALLDAPPVEAEINPLIVGAEGTGVTAVDGLVITRGKS
ncbi:MAG: acetate--CoA ligase family protein, partial [Proteobacteria bacterium]|nr:acetate--CoA ligase family protein [Pseudomonadota bacterium]